MSHDHDHDHDYDHDHDSEEEGTAVAEPWHSTPALAPRAGRGHVLFVDAFAGVAGDMLVAACLDLGVPLSVLEAAVAALDLGSGVTVNALPTTVGAIGALRFRVDEGGAHPPRGYRELRQRVATAALDAATRELALRILARLASAESRVHRVAIDAVHFHEVGAVDSIVDIVAAAACLSYLDAEVWASPLPLGRGFVTCQHGRLPLPAPATLECLRGVPTVTSGLEFELVTPTGAAILAEATTRWCEWPGGSVLNVGWGAGTHVLPDRPNALRVVLLERPSLTQARGTHEILESNLDDLTGELIAHTIQRLLDEGALDAWAVPITMKKGRPGWTLCALVEANKSAALAELLLRETSAIGLRHVAVHRTEQPRTELQVLTPFGSVLVKLSGAPGSQELHAKPEFEVCRKLAEQHGVPLRTVLQAAYDAIATTLR